MYVKPYAREVPPLPVPPPWEDPGGGPLATFSYFLRAFSRNFGRFGRFFSFLLSILRCRCFFFVFGPLKDPPGHEKTMKIMILSSKIKVSPISKKSPFETAFGTLLDHFGYHFGRLCAPWGSFWRFMDPQSASQVKKKEK